MESVVCREFNSLSYLSIYLNLSRLLPSLPLFSVRVSVATSVNGLQLCDKVCDLVLIVCVGRVYCEVCVCVMIGVCVYVGLLIGSLEL